MFGFHPFATQSFGSAIPFVDALTTTNALTSSIGTATTVSMVPINTVDIELAATIGTVVNNLKFIPETNVTTLSVSSPSVFTWATINDNVTGESWSAVSTTGTGETWTDVSTDDTTETWSNV